MIGRTFSHYRVLGEIGRGGMGVVYRALDAKLNREVVLKFLPPELTGSRDRKRRFLQEARAAASLEHPHIAVVQLYVQMVGSSEPLRLTDGTHQASHPTWSPDGQWLAVVDRTSFEQPEGISLLSIESFDLDSRKLIPLAELGPKTRVSRYGQLSVSPEGRFILHARQDGGGSDLILVEGLAAM